MPVFAVTISVGRMPVTVARGGVRFDGRVSTSPYSDLERPPLNEKTLGRLLVRPGSLWREIQVVPETGSTNADLVALAGKGAPEGSVLVAEVQTAGRGRLDRAWSAPPRSGLMFSMLLRPAEAGVTAARLGWLPLLTGVAVAAAVRKFTARGRSGRFSALADLGEPGEANGGGVDGNVLDARLKWPNDVLVGERKLAGILAEQADSGIVVGVGLNVSLHADELPVPSATSLAIEGAAFTDREPLLRAILREFETWYSAWCTVMGDPEADVPDGYPVVSGIPVSESIEGGLRQAYKNLSATLGREVRAELPGGRTISGTALDVDGSGCLVVGDQALSAGDVIHVR
ncbi:MAG: biotin--[acetyl-CoA-carboxylase] ligase [Actinomycetia bacterium]|nr:biotin--[acetyl-CoA-carboxylase] ligase [Actinomycetes bacterium]